jgi:hypothetical protein
LPRNGALNNGVEAAAEPAIACEHFLTSDSNSARVHASSIVFNRALIVVGKLTRTNLRFAWFLDGIVTTDVSGVV